MLSYIVPFLILILVVVFIHEYGHYYFARKYGVGVSAAPWTGKQLSRLVFSSNSKDLDISTIYKGLPKKFIFPQLRVFYFKLAVWFYRNKDKFNI